MYMCHLIWHQRLNSVKSAVIGHICAEKLEEEQLIVDRSQLLFSTDCPVSYNQLRWLVTALCKSSGCCLCCNVAIVCVLLACSITARFGHWRCTIFTCHWLRMRNRSTSTSLRLRWTTIKTWSVVQPAFLLYCVDMLFIIIIIIMWLVRCWNYLPADFITCDTVYLFCKCSKSFYLPKLLITTDRPQPAALL